MATVSSYQYLTALDLAQVLGLGQSQVMVVECLSKVNSFMQDAYWEEATEVLSTRGLRRLSIPTGTWRRLNAGIGYETAKEIPYTDIIGMLETRSRADKVLANAWPGGAEAYRNSRARAFIEGMSQTVSSAIVYSNAGVDPEKITGLAPRLDSLATDHVIGCGGTGSDVTSIYCVQWGPERVALAYPRGSKGMGIEHIPITGNGPDGCVDLTDGDGNKYRGFEDHFAIHFGLVVHDERCIKRVANIETTGTSNIFDPEYLTQALEEMPYEGQGAVVYCNKTVRRQMRAEHRLQGNVLWNADDPRGLAGAKVTMFDEWPVRRSDAILNTEDAIS